MACNLRIVMITLAVLLCISCVTDNQIYLIACPASNMSSLYPVSTVREGWVKRVGSLDILYGRRNQPEAVLNGCQWVMVGEEMLDAMPLVVDAYGDNIWWYHQKMRGFDNIKW